MGENHHVGVKDNFLSWSNRFPVTGCLGRVLAAESIGWMSEGKIRVQPQIHLSVSVGGHRNGE